MPRDNVKVSVIFVLINMCVAYYYTYLAQLLTFYGFDAQQVGTLLMIYVLMAVVSLPLMGFLTDNYIPDKVMILGNAIVSIISSIVFLNIEKTFLNTAIVIAIWSFCFKPIINIIESYTYKLINDGDPIDFGVVRSMGSLGGALGAFLMGNIIDIKGYSSLYYMQVFGVVTTSIAVLIFFRGRKVKQEPKEEYVTVTPTRIIKEEPVESDGSSTLMQLLKSRDYVALLIGGCLINASVSLHFTYVPLLLQDNGASAGEIGAAFSLMALCEIPIIAFFSKIRRYIRPTTLLIAAGIVYIFRMIMVVEHPTVSMFMMMGVLQSVSLGFLSPNYMYIMNRIVPRNITSTATMTGTTVIYNLSSVFSMYYGGYYIEKVGYLTVLSVGWIFCLIGTLVFILNFKVIKNKNRKVEI